MEVMEVDVTTEASLFTLPVEMVDMMFSYLESRDIKSFRRVSQRLNEITNRSFYCLHEIIFWKRIYKTRQFIELLNDSKRLVFNLYIDTVDFKDDFVLTFFRKHGSKVHSLTFKDCTFPRQLLENILRECTALRSFSYEVSSRLYSVSVFDDFCSFEAESIVLEGVTSFTFLLGRMERKWIDEPTFQRFVSIFPNVKRLDIRIILDYYDDDSRWSENNGSTQVLTYFSIRDYILRIGKNLESLGTNFPLENVSRETESFFEALPNLNHLRLDWRDVLTDINELQIWRTQLQRIPSLEIRKYPYLLSDELCIFRLKHLTISVDYTRLDSNFFFKLLQSEVQTLDVAKMSGWILPRSIVDSPLIRVNTTLTDLYLRNHDNSYETVALCLKYLGALVHLRLCEASNYVLLSIFQYQKKLRSLCLDSVRECTWDGFAGSRNGRQLSIRELQNLEHLKMTDFNASILKSRLFIRAFQLPRLKYLYIDTGIYANIPLKILHIEVFQSMSKLEALKLMNFREPPFEELISLYETSKKLRYLCHMIDKHRYSCTCLLDLSESAFMDLNVDDEHVSDYGLDQWGNESSYYDDELQRIVLKKHFDCRFFSPKISSFVIDWITF